MKNNIIKDSFVVVSDFHSCRWPLKKVTDYYINEYDKIYILGDATDRGEKCDGTGGLELLFDIKELSKRYPNRIIYIPGNHDEFVYSYAKYNDHKAESLLNINHGEQTLEDINYYRRNNQKKLEELINWLESLPIQREHYFNNQRYALAHAFFDQQLFENNPNATLQDYVNTGGYYGPLSNILWFRKRNGKYNPSNLPSSETIVVIGHTPKRIREGENLNFKNELGEIIKVFCVDGGVTFGDEMLKYDGGTSVNKTIRADHVDTSPSTKTRTTLYSDSLNEIEDIIKDVIIYMFKTSLSLDEIYVFLEMIMNQSTMGLTKSILENENVNIILNNTNMKKIIYNYGIEKGIINSIKNRKEVVKALVNYTNEVALDYIIESLVQRFETKKRAADQIYGFLTTGDCLYITNSVGEARIIAEKIGVQLLSSVIGDSDYVTITKYIDNKLGNSYTLK